MNNQTREKNSIRGLYALCDQSYRKDLTHKDMAQQLLAGGISVLQLRMKGERDLEKVRKVTKEILELKKQYNFTFILNDFVELGLELDVDGIHVGQEDMSIAQIRQLAEKSGSKNKDLLLGYSSHSLAEAIAAQAAGADYVAFGAVFPTATKGPGHPVVGVEALKQVVQTLNVPVVAIGGINQDNFDQVKATGVAAIAMIGALTNVPNITEAVRSFVRKWGEN